MKRSGVFPLLTAAALLLAAAAYGGVWLWEGLRHRMTTAVCTREVWEDSLTLTGAVLRRETVLSTACAQVIPLTEEGERLPAGAPLAIAFDDPAEAFRARLLLRLEEEEAATRSPGSREALRTAYAAALARGEQSRLPTAARGLAAAEFSSSAFTPAALRSEIDSLTAAGAAHALIFAPESGFFSGTADGWEALSPVHALTLSPRAFRDRMEAPGDVDGAFGRLVTDSGWAFAALLPRSQADLFSPGDAVTLRLPDGGEIAARVASVAGSGDESLVIFACREALSRVLSLRRTVLTAVLARWEGFSLPETALREENGEYYVRRAGLPLPEDTPVTVLCRRDDRVLAESAGLRDGMELLLREDE